MALKGQKKYREALDAIETGLIVKSSDQVKRPLIYTHDCTNYNQPYIVCAYVVQNLVRAFKDIRNLMDGKPEDPPRRYHIPSHDHDHGESEVDRMNAYLMRISTLHGLCASVCPVLLLLSCNISGAKCPVSLVLYYGLYLVLIRFII